MSLITCAGADVISGRLHFPTRGAWCALLKVDSQDLPSGQVAIEAAGGLSAQGTVISAQVVVDSVRVRVVGGANGLGKLVPAAAFEHALVRDSLASILGAAGETQSTSIDAALLTALIGVFTHASERASTALDRLAWAAGRVLGQSIGWRVLADGTLWMGQESWPAAELPAGADVLMPFPEENRYELGVETPALLPGVALEGVGNVVAVDHWIEPSEIRTWAWV